MKKILLDSCFLIGLLDKDSIHHKNAYDFFVRFSSDNDVILKISTIFHVFLQKRPELHLLLSILQKQ